MGGRGGRGRRGGAEVVAVIVEFDVYFCGDLFSGAAVCGFLALFGFVFPDFGEFGQGALVAVGEDCPQNSPFFARGGALGVEIFDNHAAFSRVLCLLFSSLLRPSLLSHFPVLF